MQIDSDQLRISAPEEMVVRWESVGTNQYPLLIVDNFYRSPQYVHELAHSLPFENPHGRHIHAQATLSHSTGEIYRFILEQFGDRLGITQLTGDVDLWRFYRSLPSGTTQPTRREDPHSDWEYLLAGLIYLTPDAHCRGGTGFFRHRATGAEEKIPPPKSLLRANVPQSVLQRLKDLNVYRSFSESKIESYRAFLEAIPFKTEGNRFHLTTSNDVWEMLKLVEMRFNRLIMYPAFILHKAIYEEDWFDGEPHKRRLTQNFFFRFPGQSQ